MMFIIIYLEYKLQLQVQVPEYLPPANNSCKQLGPRLGLVSRTKTKVICTKVDINTNDAYNNLSRI